MNITAIDLNGYVERTKIDEQRASMETLRIQVHIMLKMMKKVKIFPMDDIRSNFQS